MSEPWKILIYIAADNRLFNDALVSLRQMTRASALGGIEVLIQFDGPGQHAAARFVVKAGRKEVLWEASHGYTTDRGRRLEHFLHWADEEVQISECGAPILLVLWGHGAGLDHVYVYDKASDAGGASAVRESRLTPTPPLRVKDLLDADDANLYVKNIDLARILKKFTERVGRKIELLGLDACLMGLAEITHEVRESVSLMVASDEDIPNASWPYDQIIEAVAKDLAIDGAALAKIIVDKYVNAYNPNTDTTGRSLASYNLCACHDFAVAFKQLVRALLGELVEGTTRDRIVRAREFSRTQSEPAYIDLFVFLTELAESFPYDNFPDVHRHAVCALELLRELRYILHHRSEPSDQRIDGHGLAVYFPVNLDPEQVEAASPTAYPVQPVVPEALPAPEGPGVKTPPRNPDKNVVFPGGTTLPLQSYQVLWHDYIKLDFNISTGWSTLVRAFLPEIPKQDQLCHPGHCRCCHPPKEEKAAQ